jgi:hypothetical protein
MNVRAFAGDGEETRQTAVAPPWARAAEQPYFDGLLGGRCAVLPIHRRGMPRPSTELFCGRIVLVERTYPVGGLIAPRGAKLAQCRPQDALAAAATPPERRSALAYLRTSSELATRPGRPS